MIISRVGTRIGTKGNLCPEEQARIVGRPQVRYSLWYYLHHDNSGELHKETFRNYRDLDTWMGMYRNSIEVYDLRSHDDGAKRPPLL